MELLFVLLALFVASSEPQSSSDAQVVKRTTFRNEIAKLLEQQAVDIDVGSKDELRKRGIDSKNILQNLALTEADLLPRGGVEDNRPAWQDAVPGEPGMDYPNLETIPQTSFSCDGKVPGGYYADVETRCQVFHVCNTGGIKSSFLCPGGSIFNQKYFVCDWWYDFECENALDLYSLNDKRHLANQEDNIKTSEGSTQGQSGTNFLNDLTDLSIASSGERSSAYSRRQQITTKNVDQTVENSHRVDDGRPFRSISRDAYVSRKGNYDRNGESFSKQIAHSHDRNAFQGEEKVNYLPPNIETKNRFLVENKSRYLPPKENKPDGFHNVGRTTYLPSKHGDGNGVEDRQTTTPQTSPSNDDKSELSDWSRTQAEATHRYLPPRRDYQDEGQYRSGTSYFPPIRHQETDNGDPSNGEYYPPLHNFSRNRGNHKFNARQLVDKIDSQQNEPFNIRRYQDFTQDASREGSLIRDNFPKYLDQYLPSGGQQGPLDTIPRGFSFNRDEESVSSGENHSDRTVTSLGSTNSYNHDVPREEDKRISHTGSKPAIFGVNTQYLIPDRQQEGNDNRDATKSKEPNLYNEGTTPVGISGNSREPIGASSPKSGPSYLAPLFRDDLKPTKIKSSTNLDNPETVYSLNSTPTAHPVLFSTPAELNKAVNGVRPSDFSSEPDRSREAYQDDGSSYAISPSSYSTLNTYNERRTSGSGNSGSYLLPEDEDYDAVARDLTSERPPPLDAAYQAFIGSYSQGTISTQGEILSGTLSERVFNHRVDVYANTPRSLPGSNAIAGTTSVSIVASNVPENSQQTLSSLDPRDRVPSTVFATLRPEEQSSSTEFGRDASDVPEDRTVSAQITISSAPKAPIHVTTVRPVYSDDTIDLESLKANQKARTESRSDDFLSSNQRSSITSSGYQDFSDHLRYLSPIENTRKNTPQIKDNDSKSDGIGTRRASKQSNTEDIVSQGTPSSPEENINSYLIPRVQQAQLEKSVEISRSLGGDVEYGYLPIL